MALSYDEILARFRRNWMHYDKTWLLRPEMLALFPDYRALYRIADIDCISGKRRAVFPKTIVKSKGAGLR